MHYVLCSIYYFESFISNVSISNPLVACRFIRQHNGKYFNRKQCFHKMFCVQTQSRHFAPQHPSNRKIYVFKYHTIFLFSFNIYNLNSGISRRTDCQTFHCAIFGLFNLYTISAPDFFDPFYL